MGLLTGTAVARPRAGAPTLRAWEIGLATAAEAARIGGELLEPDDGGGPDFAEYRAPRTADYGPTAACRTRSTARRCAAASPTRRPRVPDELIPDHVDEEAVLVAEVAEEGAEDGAGAELHVEAPWDGYDEMTAADIRDRLAAASPRRGGRRRALRDRPQEPPLRARGRRPRAQRS